MSGVFPQSLLIPNLQFHSEENIPTEMNGNIVLIISWWKILYFDFRHARQMNSCGTEVNLLQPDI